MNLAYLAPTIPATLLSLCYMQTCGAHYCPDPTSPNTHCLISSSANGFLLNRSAITSNNLLPIDLPSLRSAALAHPTQYYSSPHPSSYLLTSVPHNITHITGEQRRRAEQAEALHHALGHPSDNTLSLCISTGKIPTSLVPSDIQLNRSLRGHCVHCAAGKYRAPSRPSSTSAPATTIGQTLSFDPQQLPQPSPGGFTHEVIIVDENSGYLSVVGSFSKSTAQIFKAIHSVITTTYNAHGHKAQSMHSDPEQVNNSLSVPLGSIGIQLKTSLPGDHAYRVERYIETLRAVSSAMLSPLPYHLPPKYYLYLHQAAAASCNSLISTNSSPQTSNELVRKTKLRTVPLPFGSTALVVQHIDKRLTNANKHNTTTPTEPKTELGVCLGPHPTTDHTMFVLANGRIFPRRAYLVLPPTFVPFDWQPKIHVLHVPLPPSHSPSSAHTNPSDPLQHSSSTSSPLPNHPPQLPHLPLPLAIAATTANLPSPFPTTLLDSIHTAIPLYSPPHPLAPLYYYHPTHLSLP